jgi:type III secretory pathway lipoprotein EscJ
LTRLAVAVWRWLEARGGATRWAIGIAGALLVAAIAYFSIGDGDSDTWEPLYPSAKLLRSETDRIVGALDTAKISYSLDSKAVVIVPANRAAQARNLLAAQKAKPRLLQDVLDEMSQAPSPLEGPAEREAREQRLHATALEIMIRDQPGIESANVIISRPRSRSATARGERPTALVYLKTDAEQPIAQETVDAIRHLITTQDPAIPQDGITIQDSSRSYVVAGGSEYGARAAERLKEQGYTSAIRERLKDIDGLRVFVNVRPSTRVEPSSSADEDIGINHPLNEAIKGAPAAKSGTIGRVIVLVQVPISFYLDRYRMQAKGNHDPSPEDLQPYVDKTDELIRQAVTSAVPPPELEDIKISRIDVPGRERPAPTGASSVAELRRISTWWVGVASGCAILVLALAAVGGRWLVVHRPARPLHAPHRRRSFTFDAAGPAERVRELVRRDPEAAAGVLQRWIAAGGGQT